MSDPKRLLFDFFVDVLKSRYKPHDEVLFCWAPCNPSRGEGLWDGVGDICKCGLLSEGEEFHVVCGTTRRLCPLNTMPSSARIINCYCFCLKLHPGGRKQ
jgi:hypothetical protein